MQGNFSSNMFHGEGTYTFAEGAVYEGIIAKWWCGMYEWCIHPYSVPMYACLWSPSLPLFMYVWQETGIVIRCMEMDPIQTLMGKHGQESSSMGCMILEGLMCPSDQCNKKCKEISLNEFVDINAVASWSTVSSYSVLWTQEVKSAIFNWSRTETCIYLAARIRPETSSLGTRFSGDSSTTGLCTPSIFSEV